MWRHTWQKNLINCEGLTGNSAGLRTVLSNRLSHRELRRSLRKSHSLLSLPADTTMASSQGTSVSSNSFSRWASHDIFLFKYHFLLYILRFIFFFSDNIMADVARKLQTTTLFLSTTVTRTRRHTELTKKKTDRPDRKPVLCQRNSVQFFVQFFLYIFKLHSLTYSVLVPLQAILSYRRRPARFSCCWNRKCSIICKLKICKLALILRNPWKQRGIFHCILTLFIPQLCNHFITKYQSLLYYSECVYIYIFIYLHHVLLGSKWALTSTVRNRRVSNWVNGQVQLSGLASRRSCCW